ncbi:MAG: LytTR family DNA-binding domain-containing protein [Sphingomonas sp.]
MAKAEGTSGGWHGMNGAQARLAFLFAVGFAVILVFVVIADAESMLSEFRLQGVPETATHVWIWEATSVIAWVTTMPAIWWMIAYARPPRVAWGKVAAILVIGVVIASAWHIGAMVALRKLVYAIRGEDYRFFGIIPDRLLYEFRKDVPTYLQFCAVAALAQWALARAATPPAEPVVRTLAVNDGAVTHHVPLDEIEQIAAAGNYIEIAWGPRTLLQRSTLAAAEAELGDGFVRIHRGLIVRRDAVRRIETDKSGDFTVTLASGAEARGSRRYRDRL